MKIDTKKCLSIPQATTTATTNNSSSLKQDEYMIHPNKYIPATNNNSNNTVTSENKTNHQLAAVLVTPDKNQQDDNDDYEDGRRMMYLPKILYTPVLNSNRQRKQQQNTCDRRRLVSEAGMDELNKKLEDLFIRNDEDAKDDEGHDGNKGEKTTGKVASKEDEDYVPSDDEDDDDDDAWTGDILADQVRSEASILQEEEAKMASKGAASSSLSSLFFGRFYTTAFNYETCKSSPVKRSARLLAQEQAKMKIAE